MPNNALSSGSVGIRIDEPTNRGVIVSALEVIESGFGIVVVSSVSQRVVRAEGGFQGAGGIENFAVGVIGVTYYRRATGVNQVENIALEVGDVVVGRAVVIQGVWRAVVVIEEVQNDTSIGLPQQLATGVVVIVYDVIDLLAGTQSVRVIGVGVGNAILLRTGEVSTLLPLEIPPGTVVIAGGVAGTVIGDGLTVKLGEQVLPNRMTIGIGMCSRAVAGSEDIARVVVGIGVGLSAAGLGEKLILGIVGEGVSRCVFLVGCDVAQGVIGIGVIEGGAGEGAAVPVLMDKPGGLAAFPACHIGIVPVKERRIHL